MGFDVRFGLGSGLRFGLGFRLRFGSGWGFCLRSSWGFGSLGRSGSVSDLVFRLGPSSGSRGLRFRSVSGVRWAPSLHRLGRVALPRRRQERSGRPRRDPE